VKYYKFNRNIIKEDLKEFNYTNQKIGVIALITNSKGKILLQQRGTKSSDENGLYECVSGKLEEFDLDFKEAIIREIKEEIGTSANIEINKSLGIFHNDKNDTNWLFIIFYGKYIDGEIKIMEPDKCMGYKFFDYDEIFESDLVSKGCKCLIKNIKENHN